MPPTHDVSKRIDELVVQRNKAHDAASMIVDKVLGEKRDFTADEKKAVDERHLEIEKINGELKLLERQVQVSRTLADKPERKTDPSKPDEKTEGNRDTPTKPGEESEEQRDYRKAFNKYLLRGEMHLNTSDRDLLQRGFKVMDQEQRDLSAVTGASGAYTIPQGFVNSLELAMKDFSGVLGAPVGFLDTTQGNDTPWPTANDTTNVGEQIDENTGAATADPAFGQTIFKAYTFSSKIVTVPFQLLQDSAFDVGSMLFGSLFPERLGRIYNTRFTTGNGTTQPQGVVTASTLGKTAAANNAITYDELVDLEHSVDPAYRAKPGVGFMFHDLTFALLRKLKDTTGRPIWMPSFEAAIDKGVPSTLNGRRYFINMDMAQVGAAAKSVLFGDFGLFKVRRVAGGLILRLQERYAEKGQVGFLMFQRRDSKLMNAGTNPMKHLVHP